MKSIYALSISLLVMSNDEAFYSKAMKLDTDSFQSAHVNYEVEEYVNDKILADRKQE